MASSEITNLRAHVSEHDKDARSMAILANMLMERAKTWLAEDGKSFDGTSHSDQDEAISLAEKSIELDPEESIGFAVLSTIPKVEFRKRMIFLRTAVDIEKGKKDEPSVANRVAIATSLVRLLIEPREEMARGKDRLAGKRVMRSDLSVNSVTGIDERDLYAETKLALEDAKCSILKRREERWRKQQLEANGGIKNSPLIPPKIQSLAMANYRLGTLFRTMKPRSTHCSKSAQHFCSVLDLLNPPDIKNYSSTQSQPQMHELAIKSKFWLGTFEHSLTTDKLIKVDRCPPEYVIALYSSFAATFDTQLVQKLGYQTPQLLRKLVEQLNGSKCFRRCADLGCGTGLSGVAFRDLVQHMNGVDLSQEMIAKADDRKVYDSLLVGDVESIFAGSHQERYDLVLACDVFVYIGDLRSVFKSVAKNITRHGVFAFTTELLRESESADESDGFILQPCARFAHKQCYVRNLAKETGFHVKAVKTCAIRKNGGKDVMGILAVLGLE